MAMKNIPGSPTAVVNLPIEVPGPPSKVPMASQPTPGPHGAQAPKPTHTMRVEPDGARVNPAFTNGGMTPNDYPYKGDWAVESGTHA